MSKRIPFFIGLMLLAIAVWLQVTTVEAVHNWITRLENITYDVGVRAGALSSRFKKPYPTSVVIVAIDDKSIDIEGRWPWPRYKLGNLVDALQAEGAVVIVFDMLFPQLEQNSATTVYDYLTNKKLITPPIELLFKEIIPHFDNDAFFATSVADGDVVIGMSLLPVNQTLGEISKPIMDLVSPAEKSLGLMVANGYVGANAVITAAAKNFGFINVFSDDDGVIRRIPLVMRYKDGVYGSLALEAVKVYLLSNVNLMTKDYGTEHRIEGVRLGNIQIPVDNQGQMILNFPGRAYTIPYLSATDVLHHQTAEDALAGKIVFIGATAGGLGDVKPTAVQNAFPGIEINAIAADNILKGRFLSEPAWILGAEVLMTVVLGLIMVFIFPYLGPRILSVMIIFIPIMMLYADNWIMQTAKLIFSILVPIMLAIALALFNLIYGYLFETRRREHLKEMFGQYVPEEHIDEMLNNSESFGLYGEDREMTVLFADIRGFTTISEGMSAEQLKEMLNAFFTPMTEIIFKNKGTIDKYIGDLIMAFWGAPLKDKKHAQHALLSALQMQKKVIEMRSYMAEQKWPEINIGIGLNTGRMSVGDMGSQFRRNYTVLGDAVNLGSRVESLTKYYGVNIMTTENTCREQKKFVFRLLDKVRVKGKRSGIEIYEVVCTKTEATPELLNELDACQTALQYYFTQQFTAAETAFTQLHATYPHVKLYSLYLKRLEEFAINPPGADWDGVYTHHEK